MNRTQQSTEPSMEEILASIRRIIAEEPSGSKPSPTTDIAGLGAQPKLPPNPLLNGSAAAPPSMPERKPAVAEPAAFGKRFPDVSAAGLSPQEQAGKPLMQAIDDDLAELLGEGSVSTPVATLGGGFDTSDRTWRMLEDKIAGAPSVPSSSQADKSTSAAPAASVSPSASPPSAPAPYFPPLRTAAKGGFYPPQSAPAAKPASAAAVQAAPPPAAVKPAPEAVSESKSPVNGSTRDTLAVLSERLADSSSAPSSTRAQSEAASDSGAAKPGSTSPQASVPLPPRPIAIDAPFASPFPPGVASRMIPPSAPPAQHSPVPSPAAASDPSAAAASALGALAAGLAAAAAEPVSVPVSAQKAPDAPPPRVSQPQPPVQVQVTPAAASAAPVRTLEDAVADMLRPLLQQWLQDNMPRIIEKALRVETARALKDAPKPPQG